MRTAFLHRATVVMFAGSVFGPQPPQAGGDLVESGKWTLYKFEQAIGHETYDIRSDGASRVMNDHFEFTDRGSTVPLDTTFRASSDLTPISFVTKGKSSRHSALDNSVDVTDGIAKIRRTKTSRDEAAPAIFFTVSGYSPIAQQMLMLRYWLSHGTPASLRILPQGTNVEIQRRGTEQVTASGRQATLTRYNVAGLIWGREVLWLDSDKRLVAAVTTDAEFDHFEATIDGYESLLPRFVGEAAADGMAALADLSNRIRTQQRGPLAIVGATLVDGTGKPPVADSVVIVDKGRIVAAGPRGSVSMPSDAAVFDAKGKTLLPGLWDMHAHFEQVEWGPIYLAAGVTTARDVGNELEFIEAARDAVKDGRGLGPQLLLAGIVDGSGPRAIGVERVDSPADAAHWVSEYKKHGFQQMKIYSSVKLANVKAICDEAHKAGMTCTGHIPNGLTIYQGVEAGMDQVNHIQYALRALMPRPPPGQKVTEQWVMEAAAAVDLTSPDAQREIAFLKEHGTVIDPTLVTYDLTLHDAAEPYDKLEPGLDKVAPELAEPLTNTGAAPDFAPTAKKIRANSVAMVGALHKAGVRIVAGTDQAVPGYSLYRELELYVQAGFTPIEAIQAATVVPAQVMGMDTAVGTVERGKRADLILLDANPLENIHNIRTVRYVVANGVMYPTAKLWQSVGFKP
jgi:cytosine/adenosine deaminase-related metal-dependent hydrolase